MRIKVLQKPTVCVVDGIDLRHFEPGRIYEVGTALGGLMLAERWAEPIHLDTTPAAPPGEDDSVRTPAIDRSTPPNLIKETHPPRTDEMATAADIERRRRPRLRPRHFPKVQ